MHIDCWFELALHKIWNRGCPRPSYTIPSRKRVICCNGCSVPIALKVHKNPLLRATNKSLGTIIRYIHALIQPMVIVNVPAITPGRDSSVGIATRYGLDGPGIESRWGGARFSAPIQTGPGARPASCTMGTGSFPGVKQPGRGADHPPPSSAEAKKE